MAELALPPEVLEMLEARYQKRLALLSPYERAIVESFPPPTADLRDTLAALLAGRA